MRSKYSIFQRWQIRSRDVGAFNALLLAIDHVLQRIHPQLRLVRYYFFAQPIGHASYLFSRYSTETVRPLTADDPLLQQVVRIPLEIQKRFAQGGICLADIDPDSHQLRGYIWLIYQNYTEPEHRCTLITPHPVNCILDVDVHIRSHARSSLTFARLWRAADAYLSDRGVQWTLSRIAAHNSNSLRAHQRLGGQITGSQIFLCVGQLEFMFSSQAPFIAVTTTSSRAPCIRLRIPG